MFEITVGNVKINPQINPAILDTATWDNAYIDKVVSEKGASFWCREIERAIHAGKENISIHDIVFYTGAACSKNGYIYVLAEFPDRQHVFFVFGASKNANELGKGFFIYEDGESDLSLHAADLETVFRYIRNVDESRGPKALGFVSRLGIGTRMSTAIWPAAFEVMRKYNQPANAIQNSLRELRLLSDIRKGEEPRSIHLYSFGEIKEGHTGSTFEGLWLQGVLYALKQKEIVPYGADADHIKIDDDGPGLERAKEVIYAARYYSFYTIDLSNMLNYECVIPGKDYDGEELIRSTIMDEGLVKKVMDYHTKIFTLEGMSVSVDSDVLGRLIGKYWIALQAFEKANEYLSGIKGSEKYDLELSIDESPEGYDVSSILTTKEEILFLLREFQRRNIPVTHLAPNFGVEKGVDYRMPGGLPELEKRVWVFYTMCRQWNIMLDCHSGDDLSRETRRVFRRATEGNIHFKISPSLQEMFADELYDTQPAEFGRWWQNTFEHVHEQESSGSSFALDCLEQFYGVEKKVMKRNALFHHYMYVPLGKYHSSGRLMLRDMFYSLPMSFYDRYTKKLVAFFEMLHEDLFTCERGK